MSARRRVAGSRNRCCLAARSAHDDPAAKSQLSAGVPMNAVRTRRSVAQGWATHPLRGLPADRLRRLVAGATAVAGFAALAVPAAAPAAINAPPKAPHDITVFPVRDFVSATGYKPGDDVTVELLRNGLLIGRAAGVV